MFLKQTNISYFKGIKHIGLLLVLVGLIAQTSVIAAEPKRIVVAGGDNFEPLLFLNADGEHDGIHADLWQLWLEKTGVEVELRLMDWAKTIPALRADIGTFWDFSTVSAGINTSVNCYKTVYYAENLTSDEGNN